MSKLAYLDCPTGIAGDMCLGAIVDLTDDDPTIVRKGLGWEAAAEWALVES